ncbi:MAG TPA: glycosyl transferase family 1, partial [Polyangiaceae bacterium]
MPRSRILFVAENITLAQVVRMVALARRLPADRYEVHFACGDFPEIAFGETTFHKWPLLTIDKEDALRKVERGERLYEFDVLSRYVDEELRLFNRVRPHLVVGDFRLSLAASAPLMGIPLATLINAYWSPYAVRDSFPVPDHPMVRFLGVERASRYFPRAMPIVFEHFAEPINRLRRRLGLSAIGSLQQVLCYGDYTLYPDVPELCRTRHLPRKHRYLGPITWAPALDWANLGTELGDDRPLVYVTLGSSGRLSALDAVIEAVRDLPVNALVATAGRADVRHPPPNVKVVDFAPGHRASRAAAFVVTNGGSSTGYQALA